MTLIISQLTCHFPCVEYRQLLGNDYFAIYHMGIPIAISDPDLVYLLEQTTIVPGP